MFLFIKVATMIYTLKCATRSKDQLPGKLYKIKKNTLLAVYEGHIDFLSRKCKVYTHLEMNHVLILKRQILTQSRHVYFVEYDVKM